MRLKYLNIKEWNTYGWRSIVDTVDEDNKSTNFYNTVRSYQADHVVLLFDHHVRIATITAEKDDCRYCIFNNCLKDKYGSTHCSFFTCNYDVPNRCIQDGYYKMRESYHRGGLYKNLYVMRQLNEYLRYYSNDCSEDKVLIIKINLKNYEERNSKT